MGPSASAAATTSDSRLIILYLVCLRLRLSLRILLRESRRVAALYAFRSDPYVHCHVPEKVLVTSAVGDELLVAYSVASDFHGTGHNYERPEDNLCAPTEPMGRYLIEN